MMFGSVRQVRDILEDRADTGKPISIQLIANIFMDVTPIDEITYVKYESLPSNPIWGQFQKWHRQPGAYASFMTHVEIRYASHLSPEWRRFVVCKEMCHALDESEGSHSITGRSIDNLVRQFALMSRQQPPRSLARAFQAEMLAEAGAIELLCPRDRREGLLTDDAGEWPALAELFNIPPEYAGYAFATDSLEICDMLMENY